VAFRKPSVGALSGISRTMIAMIEKGQRSPSLIICLRVADALGLQLGDVLNSIPAGSKRRKVPGQNQQ
jgi:DNA-binding XRE family transcriptional regulator